MSISDTCVNNDSTESRGLVASCIRTHILFTTTESSATDLTCK